jgi:carbon-monoxide dehydrogenase medium subunit
MIPASFDYVRASSLAQTISLLQQDRDGSKLLAGGHTLIPTLKLRLASPALLIDIGGLEELKGIELADRIRIGALTTHAELLASEPLRKRGTIGGSLSNADPAADWPAVAIAVKAELELAGPAGRRHVAAKDFFIDIMTTALDPGEVLVALNIPRPKPGAQFRYRKIRHPASGYAVVGVAVALCLQDSMVSEATIGITGATGRAFAAEAASTHLIGKPLSSQTITSAALLASEQAECLSDHYASADYRKHLVKTEIIRALASLSAV